MKILYFFLFSFLFIACNTPVINKNDVVAEVNGEQILLSELASQSKQEIFDILNTAYEINLSPLATRESAHVFNYDTCIVYHNRCDYASTF